MVLHLTRNKLHLPHINYSRTHKQYFTMSVAIRTSYSFLLLRAKLSFPSPGGNRIQALAFNARRSEQRQQPGDFLLSSCQWQLVSQPAVSLLCQSPAMVRDEKTQRLVERRAGRVNFGVTSWRFDQSWYV